MNGQRVAEFTDGFDTGRLDPKRWVAGYLPQWSSQSRSAAAYGFDGGRLALEIRAGQEPWCPEWDGELRVSSLQTGVFAGPLGSPIGQHRFGPRVVVREEQVERRLYTPCFGRVEIRAAACAVPGTMVALWMIGFEDRPDDSGEICVVEIFSRDIAAGRAPVGMGIKPHHDPRLHADFEQVAVTFDVTDIHEYAVDWTRDGIQWEIDGLPVRSSRQVLDYPMQLMLGIYAFGPVTSDSETPRFVVERVRGFPPSGGRW